MKASSSLSSIFDRLKHCNPVHAACFPQSASSSRKSSGVGGGGIMSGSVGGFGSGTLLRKAEPPQHVDMKVIEAGSPQAKQVGSPSLLRDLHKSNLNERSIRFETEEKAETIRRNIKNCSEGIPGIPMINKNLNRKGSRSLEGSVYGGTRTKNKKSEKLFGGSSPSPSTMSAAKKKKGASSDDVVGIGFYDDEGFIRSAFRLTSFVFQKICTSNIYSWHVLCWIIVVCVSASLSSTTSS